MTLKLGDRNETVRRWRAVMAAMFKGYAREVDVLGPGDEFGPRAVAWQKIYERNTGQVQDGEVSDADLANLKIVLPRRPITIYTAPGSGAKGFLGPPHDLGEWVRAILNINHVWLDYEIGGYLGLMGGNPKYSYDDVVGFVLNALTAALDRDPELQQALLARRVDPKAVVAWEGWFSGYSQGADAIKRAVATLFGPGGKYELVRDRINGIITVGDPTTPGTGIARLVWVAPPWINALTHVINNPKDFYGIAGDRIRPLFYEWFTKAETELPFVIYTGQIVIPALLNLVAPFLGGLTDSLALPILASQTGLGVNTLSPIMNGVTAARSQPNPDLIKLLSVQGLLTSLPDLLSLITSLPGLAEHGNYYAPKAEFADPSRGWGPRSGLQVGYDIIAGFRR